MANAQMTTVVISIFIPHMAHPINFGLFPFSRILYLESFSVVGRGGSRISEMEGGGVGTRDGPKLEESGGMLPWKNRGKQIAKGMFFCKI